MNDLKELGPCLTRLKLSGMRDILEVRTKEAMENQWSFSRFLLTLLMDEVSRRDNLAYQRRLWRSELDAGKTLESFNFDAGMTEFRTTFRELSAGAYLDRRENLFIHGPSGVGKSHLAQALGHSACRQGRDVLYRRTSPFLKHLAAGHGDGSYGQRLSSAAKVPLIILDDFGLEELGEPEQASLFDLIHARYEKASLIITSNRDFDEWQGIFRNPLIASAAVDRLIHRAIRVSIDKESYRLGEFMLRNRPEKSQTSQAK